MGAFLTNYQVRGKSSNEVCEAMAKLVKSHAYVSPEKSGWVTVYDFDSDLQDEKIITNLAAGLSKALNTFVLAFLVHDSDIAVYWLYQNGTLADEFNSDPDYFQEASEADKLRVRGDADELLPLCVAGTTREQVEEVIHPADGFSTFAENILEDLAKLLGIDEARISVGFRYFEEEGEEILPDASEFTPIGKKAAPKKKRTQKPAKQKLPFDFDMFPIAIGMMTKVWTGEHEKMAEAFSGRFPNQDSSKMVSQLREGFDRSARDFLKKSKLPNLPNFEELRSARDEGSDSLAKLLVKRTPTQLGSITDGAIGVGLKVFVSALLANGMDPKTQNQHGQSLLEVAERCNQPEIYSLLKSAIDKKG